MLSAHCSRHGHTVLVPTSSIESIDNTDAGIVVRWHCSCGQPGTTRFPKRSLPPRPALD